MDQFHHFDLNQVPQEDNESTILEDDGNTNVSIDEDEAPGRKISPMLSNMERLRVYYASKEKTVNGILRKKATAEVAMAMSIPVQTIRRIWAIHKKTPENVNVDVSHKKSNCGKKRVSLDMSTILQIPLQQRTTFISLSHATGVPLVTLHRLLKSGQLRSHSNAIKPHLKEENKSARLQFCLSMMERTNFSTGSKFIDMYNHVHIDEKWFYMTKKKKHTTYYRLRKIHCEHVKSKNFIEKVMFLVAMARPRFDREGKEEFDGKIGVFPFVHEHEAQRSSRNRNAGILEMKAITSVTREIMKDFLLSKVIPTIQAN